MRCDDRPRAARLLRLKLPPRAALVHQAESGMVNPTHGEASFIHGSPANPDLLAVVSSFERYLSLWIVLCIAASFALGSLFPGAFRVFAGFE
ncbi:hypothetical protein GGQ83_003519 [Roseococcus suduntuyensis]|uniref:Uncharacterized protein n=1 Tax=Roseococcus suduntuyensis TaxID=455361 RepID=A0A840AGN7_9PROT|nr:hypothetical protein [Roseococcus suduntuyensis]MBB3900052.1 hypothetical protein [Roseococcus suduntuyensis]